MKYLKKFNNHNNYSNFTQTADFVKPNVSLCVEENEVHYNPIDYSKEYLTFVALEDGTFQLSTNIVSYSLDNGETWTELAANTASPIVTTGNKIIWKGELTPSSSAGIGTFSATGNFDVQGNAMSLLYGDNYKGQTDLTGKSYAFYRLFRNNTKVVSAENLSLPATTLVDNCYQGMFNGCTSLTTAPELPATTLSQNCYQGMFNGCASLVTAPELPATTLTQSCYSSMFASCTSLITAPELPATTLAKNCYMSMFMDCTNLINAPTLPATTLVDNCYQGMFNGCTSLVTAPELPVIALTKNCYNSMFINCVSLVKAPELPATTLAYYCYSGMFWGCTNLNYIKAMFTTTPTTSYTSNWVKGVSATGTFVKNSAATWTTTGVNSIPTGWTVETASE